MIGLKLFLLFYVLSQKGEGCLCKPGFLGHSCMLGFYNDSGAGQWWRVSEGHPDTPPRTGSAGVYLSTTGAMYLFGGEREMFLISTNFVYLVNKPIFHPLCFNCSSTLTLTLLLYVIVFWWLIKSVYVWLFLLLIQGLTWTKLSGTWLNITSHPTNGKAGRTVTLL